MDNSHDGTHGVWREQHVVSIWVPNGFLYFISEWLLALRDYPEAWTRATTVHMGSGESSTSFQSGLRTHSFCFIRERLLALRDQQEAWITATTVHTGFGESSMSFRFRFRTDSSIISGYLLAPRDQREAWITATTVDTGLAEERQVFSIWSPNGLSILLLHQ